MAKKPTLAPQSSEDFRHPTVTAKKGLDEVVSFTPLKVVEELPTPWPRYQEIVTQFGASRKVPTKDDLVLAVSHAWSHQLHPDPLGKKAETVKKLTTEALKDHKISGEPLLFYDFMSMSQNPFEPGQPERSAKEQQDFLQAIAALPEVFFTADAVLHVDGDWPDLEVERTRDYVRWSELSELNLKENGNKVIGYTEVEAKDGTVAQLPLYTIQGDISGVSKVKSISDVHAMTRKGHSLFSFGRCCGEAKEVDALFMVQPSPLGVRNAVPAGERGWIYFERLVSTIRVALTDEQYAARTVYANVPELKEAILVRAKKLRESATKGNEELTEQFQKYTAEIYEKTFSATSLDKKKASAISKVKDVDLVASLLDNLRERVSLALAMTVRNLSLAECTSFLEMKADLTIQDGRGYTPLHNATRWRNVEVVNLLLQHGSSAGQRDKLGNTAAHVIPLYADETTLQLLQALASDDIYLRKLNRAGLRVLDRMEVWALTAVNGGPYKPILNWLTQKKEEHASLVGDVTTKKSARRHGRFDVRSSTSILKVGEEERKVQHIEPAFQALGRILYLGFPRFIPWSLQAPALQSWAAAEGFDIWAITEDSVKPGLLKEGPDAFMQDLRNVVHALLPLLGEKFVLVDSSFGPGTFLAWELHSKLTGAMIINTHLFNAPDFEQTELAQKIRKRMAFLGETYGKRDYDAILTLVSDFMYPTGGAEGVEETTLRYKEALEEASPNFWKMSMLQPSYNFDHLTGVFTSLPEWPSISPPVVLAASDQAPLVVVGEAMQRLQQIMPESKLEFIPNSKWSWHLEGDDVIDAVTERLTSILPSRVETMANTTLVQAGGEQRPVVMIQPKMAPITKLLYIGFPRFIPFSLQQPILEHWAATELVQIWAITEDSVKPGLLKEGPDAFMQDLRNVVHALLPLLGEKFVLVDSSFGPGTFLAWELHSKLTGAMIINTHLFNAPDFEQTELAQKIRKRMAFLGETYGKRDYDAILTLVSDFMYPTGGAEGVEETKLRYKEALEEASPNFWKMSMLQPSYNFDHLTGVFTSLPEWPSISPPVVLAASDQAPLVVVGEAMQRLQQIMPESKLEFIPNSKWSWHLEGDDVRESVTDMLAALLPLGNSNTVPVARAVPLIMVEGSQDGCCDTGPRCGAPCMSPGCQVQ